MRRYAPAISGALSPCVGEAPPAFRLALLVPQLIGIALDPAPGVRLAKCSPPAPGLLGPCVCHQRCRAPAELRLVKLASYWLRALTIQNLRLGSLLPARLRPAAELLSTL